MAEQKHTPGPWETHFGFDETGYPCFFIHGMSGDAKRDHAVLANDAHLIAAAPDLLAALKEALSELATEYPIASRIAGNWPEMVPVFERINAAIAKAEGR